MKEIIAHVTSLDAAKLEDIDNRQFEPAWKYPRGELTDPSEWGSIYIFSLKGIELKIRLFADVQEKITKSYQIRETK